MIDELRFELQRRRSARQRRTKFIHGFLYLVGFFLVYLFLGWIEAPAKDIAELTASQKHEVVSRGYGR